VVSADLVAEVAHDFNNVLLAQRGYAELALQHLERGDVSAAQGAVRGVLEAADRGARLTGHLLAFARRQAIGVEVIDLNAVITGLERLLRTLVGQSVSLHIGLAPAPLRVRADLGQLERAITNLAVNARDAMPTGGELNVLVATPDDGRTAILEIADTGVGMDSATAQRIFEPFFTTKGAAGTGLGLAIVHGVITQSGGRIAVRSTPGGGTTFTVSIPTAE